MERITLFSLSNFCLTNNCVSGARLVKLVSAAELCATGKIPHCDISAAKAYSSPPPYIFSKKIWSLVVDVFQVWVCISHLDIMQLCGSKGKASNVWQTSLLQYFSPTVSPGQTWGLFVQFWNVLFKGVSCSATAQTPHYQNVH